jgi:uncharacterized protein YbaA (DUF1428 family)
LKFDSPPPQRVGGLFAFNLKTLPFDAKRMIYGGFENLVKA